MDPQSPAPQQNIPVASPPPVQPVQSAPLKQKKNNKLLWIIAGVIVLIIGIVIGIVFRK